MPARKEANPTLGTIDCPDCDGMADVRQCKRGKGRYLYTTCPNCGTDQRNGKQVQTRLFYETHWRPNVDVTKPPCVGDKPKSEKEPNREPKEPSKTGALEGDVILKNEPNREPARQPNRNRKEPMFFGLLLALGLGVGALVAR